MLWKDLDPDDSFLATLAKAGLPPRTGTDIAKRKWGTAFANACAIMFADAIRAHSEFRDLEIRPRPDGSGTESLTGVGGGGKKKVDVIVSSLSTGLQVALSLKAENFSGSEGTFGKNFLNRVYELQDEVRSIHDYQPRAFVVGVFMYPLEAAFDRGAPSTFARAVGELRSRTGRLDFSLPAQLNRLDWSIIGLYQATDASGGPKSGVVRYFGVETSPPLTGRPKVSTTMSLTQVVERIAREYARDPAKNMEYVEPEE